VTHGALLRFGVQGKDIGEELSLARAGRVRIEAAVLFDPERDDIDALEVVERGEVIRRCARQANPSEIRCRFEHPVRQTSWLALRASGRKVAAFALRDGSKPDPYPRGVTMAHTAPIFVTVRGTPPLGEQPRAKVLAASWLGRLETLEATLHRVHHRDQQVVVGAAREREAPAAPHSTSEAARNEEGHSHLGVIVAARDLVDPDHRGV